MAAGDTVIVPPSMQNIHPSDPVRTADDVTRIVDQRIRLYEEERRRHEVETRKVSNQKKWMTYGGIGAAGLGLGIGSTLIVQKLRGNKNRGGGGPQSTK